MLNRTCREEYVSGLTGEMNTQDHRIGFSRAPEMTSPAFRSSNQVSIQQGVDPQRVTKNSLDVISVNSGNNITAVQRFNIDNTRALIVSPLPKSVELSCCNQHIQQIKCCQYQVDCYPLNNARRHWTHLLKSPAEMHSMYIRGFHRASFFRMRMLRTKAAPSGHADPVVRHGRHFQMLTAP